MSYSLTFDPSVYELKEEKVITAQGEKTVVYKEFAHIPYVAEPVDIGYQSLNIHVPVSVDGVEVDPGDSPMIILIGVGGYTAIPNDPSLFHGPGGGHGGPDGGPEGPGKGPGGPLGGVPDKAFPSSDKPFGDTYEKAGTDSGPKALARGWVVVIPGVRGHDNQFPDGKYYGKAPAAIVDLKAVVRYLRHNRGVIPGDVEKIFASGGSASGALASLMAVSGNYSWYEPYLKALGAADERDDVFGCLAFCPITDLSHADGAYEWQYGGLKASSMFSPEPLEMDANVTKALAAQFREYIDSRGWIGRNGFGPITSGNLGDYILKEYLVPSCQRFLMEQSEAQRSDYLARNPWISWDGKKADFTFEAFTIHCGRSKTQPAFDDKAMQMEPAIFGTEAVNGRHFTDFGLRFATGHQDAKVDDEVVQLERMMNAMYFLPGKAHMAKHWWIRHGACDKDTSLPVITDLATALENAGADVNVRLVWDGGHGADDEKFEMLDWIDSVIR